MTFKLCSAAVLIATSLATVGGAHAREARIHAFDCKTFGGTPVDRDFSLQNDSTTQFMNIVCPIPDTSSFPKASIATLNIHGFDNGGTPGAIGVRGRICASTWHTTGGFCTGFETSGGAVAADYSLRLVGASRWRTDQLADFGYIHISLPPKNPQGVRASFRGYFMSDQ